MEDKSSLLNELFEREKDIELIKKFHETKKGFEGSISLNALPKPDLLIKVTIPFRFPYSNGDTGAIFICDNAGDTLHVNSDNSLCIHSPKIPNFSDRLKEEIVYLKKWRDDYYINNNKDKHYDYLITEFSDIRLRH